MTTDDATFVPSVDDVMQANAEYASDFSGAGIPVRPGRKLAIVTCMDARIDAFAVMGLQNGESHIIRNAGGVITDDVIRSLCLSQRFLGTREIILVHHTDCGLQMVDEADFRDELEIELGVKPWWSLESFSDPYQDVRQSMQRVRMTPFIQYKDHVSGFVYDVTDGLLHPVDPGAATVPARGAT
ncbi:beta-class carbonic anhydrase [Ilumatobacter coccineus]|jgi:carbonic anhydrase|uniref:carbonic anhydrase n=1 Tax=Ilumatobacter coccineus (strain NBRC 103263 / KCTC 29153 / YM16-304) TaxID=1313172 RepID=A0A6C7EBK0_ILUCY|nr:carbonic anhydrase [Ilumatobacter coccineus]BAN04117.1 carbonic anhydrase [Ilumatobacter coccineus YM16-304]